MGNVHFVINIFVLDLYGQHFGNICKLNIYVGIRCKLPIIWEYCNLNIYFGIGYILGGICQVGGFCALCVHRVGEFVCFVIHICIEYNLPIIGEYMSVQFIHGIVYVLQTL